MTWTGLLPTPGATNPNESEDVETWKARREKLKAKGINGNGCGTPLGIAVRMLLPTPTSSAEARPDHNWKDGEPWWKQTRASRNVGALVEHPERLTSSPQASLASPPPALEKEKAQAMTAGSGRRCLQRFKRLVRDGSSWRMSLVSSLLRQEWYSSAVFLTWKLKGTRFNRCLFQLAVSAPRTRENDFGLLQSPMPSDVDGGRTTKGSKRQGETGLRWQLLATPRASDPKKRGNMSGDPRNGLPGQIAMLPTPASVPCSPESHNQVSGQFRVGIEKALGTNTGMRLQPAFVEWMMGYTEGWTELESYPPNPRYKVKRRVESIDCEPSETASYHK